jgi:hypothetical protein
MANTTIKISQLPNVGNLTTNTLFPVVSTNGILITDKINLGNLANFVLTEAGNLLQPAFVSEIAYGVANAAQPNITSVGTLNSLTITNVSTLHIPGGTNGYVLQTNGNGNLNWTAMSGSGNGNPGGANTQVQFNDSGVFGGDVGFTYNKTTDILNVTNISISANVIANKVSATGNISANYFIGDGSQLTGVIAIVSAEGPNNSIQFNNAGNIAGNANLTFDATTSTLNIPIIQANSINISSGGNIYESVTEDYAALIIRTEPTHIFEIWGNDGASDYKWVFDQNGNFTLPGNTAYIRGDEDLMQLFCNNEQTTGLGLFENLELSAASNVRIFSNNANTLNLWVFDDTGNIILPGNGEIGINYANGSPYGGSGGSELINGDNSFALQSDGNVVFSGSEGGVNRGLVWDFGVEVGGVNSEVRQDNNGLTVRAWTEVGGGGTYAAPVNIVTNQDANAKTWIFDGEGDLILPGNMILASGNIRSNVITPAFNSGITGINSGSANVIITISDEIFEGEFSGQVTISGVNPPVQANGDWWYQAVDIDQFQLFTDDTFTTPVDGTDWPGYVDGGTAVGIGTYSNFTIQGGNISITSNSNTWIFDTTGNLTIPNDIISTRTIDIDNRASGNTADIQLFAADDIVLQARDRSAGSGTEGGDINIYAGDSAEDGDSSGGDVQIRAGDGGAGNVDLGGNGGFITIQSGRGGAATGNTGATAQSGGALTLSAGDAGDNNGDIELGAAGGAVYIESGFSTGGGDYGGEIVLTTGTGGQNAASGNVRIVIPGYGLTTGGTWKFDGNGNLTLPANTFAVNYANGTPVTFGEASLGNVTFDDVTVQGVNGLNLSAGADFTANLAYLQVRAGDVASHIHLDTGNNEAYDLIVGDDQNYVQVSSTGNILLSSYDSNTAQYIWTLDYNGNLILAGGNSVIQSIANSSLDPVLPNVSTMVFTPDSGYGSQALVLDPTAPGHIHLRAPGANIDEPYANIFLGGEGTSFEVTQGLNNVAKIHSGGNTWTFGNDGVTTSPVLTVDQLPVAIAGMRAFVSDANLVAVGNFGNVVGNGGSNTVCVWSDGTDWRIG